MGSRVIKKEEFFKKYPDIESFKKDYPIGRIFKFYDRTYWEIRGYTEDEFPNGEKVSLVLIRTFSRYKEGRKWIRHWKYNARELYDFYSFYDFCKREFGNEFTKEKWEEHDNEV